MIDPWAEFTKKYGGETPEPQPTTPQAATTQTDPWGQFHQKYGGTAPPTAQPTPQPAWWQRAAQGALNAGSWVNQQLGKIPPSPVGEGYSPVGVAIGKVAGLPSPVPIGGYAVDPKTGRMIQERRETVGETLGKIPVATGLVAPPLRTALGVVRQARTGIPVGGVAEDVAQKAAKAAVVKETKQSALATAQESAVQDATAQAAKAVHPPLQVKLPISPKLVHTLKSEQGSINVQPIADYLQKQHQVQTFAGDLGDKLYQIHRQADAAGVEARNLLRTVGKDITPADWEAIYHARELRDTTALTEPQRHWYNVVSGMLDATEEIKQSLPKPIRPVTGVGYIRRFALGEGSLADRAKAGLVSGRTGLLRTRTDAFKHRRYVSLTDTATGTKQVIAQIQGRLVAPSGESLGTMARLKSHEELMAKDLAPLERQLDKVTHQLQVFRGWSERSPARVNAVVNALAKNLGKISDTLANEISTMIPKLEPELRREQQRLQRLYQAFQEARAIGGTPVVKKFDALQERLAAVRQNIDQVKARYDPASLDDKVFIGKDGKRYLLGEPTTAEIEAQTPQRYYKNALFSAMVDHLETMQIARANAFLEHLKQDPDFLRVAMPPDLAWQAPKGWLPTEAPQFIGWRMDPKVARTFNAAMPQSRSASDIVAALSWMSRSAVNIGFANPLIHTPNVGANWIVDRGALRNLNPLTWNRLRISSVKAWNAAVHINEDYLDVMRHGGGVMRENGTAAEVRTSLLDMARRELQDHPDTLDGMATHLGRTAKDIVDSPWWLSHHATWATNDFFYLQRVFEREMEGMSRIDAIRETDRFIPNYRLPGTILGSGDLSSVLRNRMFVIFAPYHYGVLKAWGQMTNGLLGRVPMAERLAAADKLAMAGILLFAVVPAMDHVFQQLTGNRRTRARRPGMLAPAYNLGRTLEGTLPVDYAVESMVSPSPLVGSALDLAHRREEWTTPGHSPTENLVQALKIAGGGIAPYSIRQMIQQGAGLGQTILSPVMTQPKLTPAESAVRQFMFTKARLQSEVTGFQMQGKDQQAQRAAHAYNDRLRQLVTQALKDEGVPVNSSTVEQFVRQHGVKLGTAFGIQQKERRKEEPFSIQQVMQKRPPGRTYVPGPAP